MQICEKQEAAMTQKKLSTQELCMTGLITAVIAVTAQIIIPMPLGVPMTLQTFGVTLAGILLGAKKGFLSAFIYLLVGAVGVPVFAGFTGGLQSLTGPTGGFLLSFPLMAYVIGLGADYRHAFKGAFLTALIGGTILNYVVGLLMFCVLTNSPVAAGFYACVLPFIPTAILKAVLASVLGLRIRSRYLRFRL